MAAVQAGGDRHLGGGGLTLIGRSPNTLFDFNEIEILVPLVGSRERELQMSQLPVR